MVKKESGCSFHCDRCVHRNKVYSLRDRIYNSHDNVMSGGLQKFNHKINTECIPLCIQNREQLKFTNWRVSPGFRLEVKITGAYILANIPRHLRPPVVLEHQFQCLPGIQGDLQYGCCGRGLQSVCIGPDFEVRISSLRTGTGHLCLTTLRSALSCQQSVGALVLSQQWVPLSLHPGFLCICWTRSSIPCLSVPLLPRHALQGTLVEGGQRCHFQRLCFRDQLSSTVHLVCPQYVWGGDEARS